MRPRLPKLPKNIAEAAHWYMRYVSPISLVAALFLDYFVFLRRVDLWTGNLLLLFYLLLAAACIALMNLIETGKIRHPRVLEITPLIPVATQFAFGGLFGGYFSLYSRSAAIEITWIFIGILALLLIVNERFARLYNRFVFQFSVFFTVLFSFLIFFLPVIFKRVGPEMFLVSGVASIAAIISFYYLIGYFVPERAVAERTRIARSIAAIYIAFNILYFTGAIPPLPLALKDAGVYHAVTRSGDSYNLVRERAPWYALFLRYNLVFHRLKGDAAHVYTAIFAPTGLSMTVYHEWQHRDSIAGAWITAETVPFFIVGGRDGGYRGYSMREAIESGQWRVNVLTSSGQLIGRISFTVVDVATSSSLETVVR